MVHVYWALSQDARNTPGPSGPLAGEGRPGPTLPLALWEAIPHVKSACSPHVGVQAQGTGSAGNMEELSQARAEQAHASSGDTRAG